MHEGDSFSDELRRALRDALEADDNNGGIARPAPGRCATNRRRRIRIDVGTVTIEGLVVEIEGD